MTTFLQWVQWLWQRPLSGSEVVCVNVDETPLFRQISPKRGYVIRALTRRDPFCYARVPLRDRRGQSTLLAGIVNVPDLQKFMPQFILTNDKILTNGEKAQLRTLPSPLSWVIGTKGWVSANIFKQLLTGIRRAIRAKNRQQRSCYSWIVPPSIQQTRF